MKQQDVEKHAFIDKPDVRKHKGVSIQKKI